MRKSLGIHKKTPLMKRLVQSILDFLLKSGMTPGEIEDILYECLPRVGSVGTSSKAINKTNQSHRVGNGDVSAELMRVWHRDSKFLDCEANPRPLQLNRGAMSLVALVRRLDPLGDPKASIKVMRAVGLIRRCSDGRYLPTAESVKIDHLHPLAIEHIAKSVVRLVATVCRNTDQGRKAIPLIERYAYAPDMNKAEAIAFAEFTRTQGMSYLEAVDDWLEQRRVKSKSTSRSKIDTHSVAAGVHLFAYMDDFASRPSRGANSLRQERDRKKIQRRLLPVAATSSRAVRA